MAESSYTIVVDPQVRFGKPTFRGTRVTVSTIVAKLAAGIPAEELMQEYDLTQADMYMALHYQKLK
jgi:uncharacterized protein (DUF433 family)